MRCVHSPVPTDTRSRIYLVIAQVDAEFEILRTRGETSHLNRTSNPFGTCGAGVDDVDEVFSSMVPRKLPEIYSSTLRAANCRKRLPSLNYQPSRRHAVIGCWKGIRSTVSKRRVEPLIQDSLRRVLRFQLRMVSRGGTSDIPGSVYQSYRNALGMGTFCQYCYICQVVRSSIGFAVGIIAWCVLSEGIQALQ